MSDAQKDSAMNRWLWIGSLAGLLVVSTGCLHHQTRGGCSTGNCGASAGSGGACPTGTCGDAGSVEGGYASASCGNGDCGNGSCGNGNCGNGGKGLLGKMNVGGCQACNGGRPGCVAGKIGWQQGGLDYSSHLRPGLLGHHAGERLNSRPFTPGPPTGQVAYPYYTVRGPRDFLLNDPPTIGR
jgi:hypothetical protein